MEHVSDTQAYMSATARAMQTTRRGARATCGRPLHHGVWTIRLEFFLLSGLAAWAHARLTGPEASDEASVPMEILASVGQTAWIAGRKRTRLMVSRAGSLCFSPWAGVPVPLWICTHPAIAGSALVTISP